MKLYNSEVLMLAHKFKWLLACALVALLSMAMTPYADAGNAGDIDLYNVNYTIDSFYSSAQGNICHKLNQNGAYGPAGSETITFLYSSAPRDLYLATGGNCNGNIYRIPANQGQYAFSSPKCSARTICVNSFETASLRA